MGIKENKIMVFVGKSAAGKDSLSAALVKSTLRATLAISTTSRKQRAGEIDGVDYHFVDHEVFMQKYAEGEFWDACFYNMHEAGSEEPVTRGWGFERGKNLLDKRLYVAAIDLSRLKLLREQLGDQLLVVLVQCPEALRKKRAKLRDSNFSEREWNRRKEDEDRLFASIQKEVDYIVDNADFEVALTQVQNIYDWAV